MALFSTSTRWLSAVSPKVPRSYSKTWLQQQLDKLLAPRYIPTTQNVDIRKFDAEILHRYTTGRWIFNEEAQFARRYVKFNLPGLVNVCVKALGAKECVGITKLLEGNFDKTFLVDTGRELIAKIPHPNAGPSHFTTASEVATMDYVQTVLGIPVPRVYDWSASTDNPVEAEYILLERSRAVELAEVWATMTWDERSEIVQTLVKYDAAFASANLPMYGSLYYAKNLPSPNPSQYVASTDATAKGEAFAVGPTTRRHFFSLGRDQAEIYRGPWSSPGEFVTAHAHCEMACINRSRSFPAPRGFFGGPNQYRPSRELKIEMLQNYLKVATQILPSNVALSKPVLWHDSLCSENIFVDPAEPSKILNAIGWQAANIAPCFIQARHPPILRLEDHQIPNGLKPVPRPDGFDEMSEAEQAQAEDLLTAQWLHQLYTICLHMKCPEAGQALHFGNCLPAAATVVASDVFDDREVMLFKLLILLQDKWDAWVDPPLPCPLAFTPEDRERLARLEASRDAGVKLLSELHEEIGTCRDWTGWTSHEKYPLFMEREARCREKFLERFATTEAERKQWLAVWPFADRPVEPPV